MIEDKTKTANALTASMNQLSAEVDSLSTAIKDNTKSIAAMQKSIEEMTAERQEQKTENAATVKDAQDAQTAISQAIAVLEDFYKSTGEVQKEPWELTQVGVRSKRVSVRRAAGDEDVTPEGAGELSEPEPQLWSSKKYTGTDTGSGVIGMLTNIATDFASMEAKARSDETSQQDNYDKEMTATKIDISEKQSDSEQKEARRERMNEKLTGKTNDRTHNTNELAATNKYETDLQKACVDGDSTYEERRDARTVEIGALQDAQKILEEAFDEK